MAYTRKRTSSNYLNSRFMNEDCKVNAAFDTFSGRWTTQVVFCIHFGLNRFGLIKKRLPRISDQILGLRLNQLVKNKLALKQEVNGEKLYSLTEKGVALTSILNQLAEWQTLR